MWDSCGKSAAASGKIVWQIDTGQSAGGGLVTYQVGGRQLVAMASGMKSPIWPGGSDASRIVVYVLPRR
jgi:alcohol dehydrogenase (cytochrome c)